MNFKLGKRSIERLDGVDERMVEVVKLAINFTKQDFTVLEGVRTKERQAELVARGASRTMNSKHIGGFAVDLGAYDSVTGIRWEEACYNPIADAMKKAAKELKTPMCWGGAWATHRGEYPFDFCIWNETMEKANKQYHQLRKSQDRQGFNDMPHFELIEI